MTITSPPTVSVVVITWNRPAFVDDCLRHLGQLEMQPVEVLVVDASADSATAEVASRYPFARWLPFPGGAGHMTASRNEALLHATGDVIAYLDDDANVRSDWLTRLVECYDDERVGAVCGRTLNHQPGEDTAGVDAVGRLLTNGELTGNFAARTAAPVRVDHGIGANMSFRRSVLAELGGFRDWFPGTALREDTDMFLRVGAAGHRVIFTPFAVVEHVAAPHVKGRRFDFRYVFWAHHNHLLLLALNFGLLSGRTLGWVVRTTAALGGMHGRNRLRRVFRILVALSGLLCGSVTAVRRRALRSVGPSRQDAVGMHVSASLAHRSRPLGG